MHSYLANTNTKTSIVHNVEITLWSHHKIYHKKQKYTVHVTIHHLIIHTDKNTTHKIQQIFSYKNNQEWGLHDETEN